MSELVWGLSNWQFYLSALWFLLVIFFILCPSGFLLLRPTQFSLKWRALLSFPLGVLSWGLISWIASGVSSLSFDQNLPSYLSNGLWLNYLFILATIFGIFFWRADFLALGAQIKKSARQKSPFYRHQFIILTLLILLGLIIQLPAVFSSGLLDKNGGISFYFTNIPDGVMHLSFIESMQQTLPPVRPEVAGEPLLDYHYFSDLFIARLGQIFHLPTFNLFFQYLPLILSAWSTLLIFQIVLSWTINYEQKKSASLSKSSSSASSKKSPYLLPAIFVTLVFLLAGDGVYLMEFYWRHRFNFGTPTFDNGAEQFLNMPQMYAKLIFLATLALYQKFIQPFFTKAKTHLSSANFFLAIILALSVGLLTYYKIYFAILFFLGWGFSSLYLSYLHFKTPAPEKSWPFFYLNWLSLFFSALLAFFIIKFNSSPSDSLSPFVYSSLIWPKIIVGDDHLGMGIWLFEQEVFLRNHVLWPVFKINIKIILTSLIAIYGLRLLGFYPLKKTRQIMTPVLLWFFIPGFFIFTFIGMNFIQVKGFLNTFNFFVITCIGLNFIFGLNLASLWQNSLWHKFFGRTLVILLLILISFRTGERWWSEVSRFYGHKPDQYFNHEKVEALSFIRNLPQDSIIQALPIYQDSAIVSAFTGHQTYLSDQGILTTHDYDFSDREIAIKNAFSTNNLKEIKSNLHQLGISYLYMDNNEMKNMFERTASTTNDWPPIFINQSQAVFAVN